MRKLINIWKALWQSHWLKRAIHTLSLLRKCSGHHLSPEGRGRWQQSCKDTCHIHQWCSADVTHLRCRITASFPAALYFEGCLSFLNNQTQQITFNRSHYLGASGVPQELFWDLSSLMSSSLPWKKQLSALLAHLQTKLGGYAEALEGRAASWDLGGTGWQNPGEIQQGQVQSLTPCRKEPCAATPAPALQLVRTQRSKVQLKASYYWTNTSVRDLSPHWINSILTWTQTEKKGTAGIRVDFYRPAY